MPWWLTWSSVHAAANEASLVQSRFRSPCRIEPLLAATGGVFAPFTVGMALCGVRKTLPLKGATKVKFGDSSFVFCCSGWGGPEDDEVVMLAALEAAGFKAGEDGVFVK
jgi:hypothetical protein